MNVSKDLVAASATPMILAILKENDSYGYSIIKRVKELQTICLSGLRGCCTLYCTDLKNRLSLNLTGKALKQAANGSITG